MNRDERIAAARAAVEVASNRVARLEDELFVARQQQGDAARELNRLCAERARAEAAARRGPG